MSRIVGLYPGWIDVGFHVNPHQYQEQVEDGHGFYMVFGDSIHHRSMSITFTDIDRSPYGPYFVYVYIYVYMRTLLIEDPCHMYRSTSILDLSLRIGS